MDPKIAKNVAVLARDQYGVATYRQLRECWMSHDMVKSRVRCGDLVRLYRAVYAIGYVPRTPETQWMAAVLACGEDALLSHRSAATLWGIRLGEGRLPDVSVPTGNGRRQRRIALHRVALAGPDVAEHRGIPVTSVARTLADLSPLIDEDALYRAVREAMYRRLFDVESAREVVSRRRVRGLRLLVEDLTYVDSELEADFLRLCKRHGVPRPRTQHRIRGFKADFAWPGQRVVVEVDGIAAHHTLAAFHADRAKTNVLVAAGWRVLRFTHAHIRRRPARTASTLRRVLGV